MYIDCVLLPDLNLTSHTCHGESSLSKKGVFGSSSSFGQDAWEASGFKAMCLSKLGKFVASWISLRPNVSGYILSVAAGSWRVVFSAQVPGLISIYCWLDRDVSNLWGSAFVLGSWSQSTVGNTFLKTFLDWVFFSYSSNPAWLENNPAFQHRCFCFSLLMSLAHQEQIDRMPSCFCLLYWYFLFLGFAPECSGCSREVQLVVIVTGRSVFISCLWPISRVISGHLP